MRPSIACLLALALVGGIVAPVRAQEPESRAAAPELVESLRKLVELRDDHGLLERAERELVRDPASVLGLQYRAYALERLGRTQEALAAYVQLVAGAPAHAWGLTQLARLRAQGGRTADAEALYRRAIEADATTTDARYALAALLRARGLAVESVAVVRAAAEHDADTARAQAELGYALWCNQAHEDARAAWKAARDAGHDAATCDRALELVLHDQATLPVTTAAARATRERRAGGAPWSLRFGSITVVTRVGPRLTPAIETLLTEFPARIARHLDAGSEDAVRLPEIVIHLARTREEHEERRRRLFPRGPRDKAFLMRAVAGRGPGGRAAGAAVPAEIHACWFPAGLETSLVHELTHAVVQDRARFLPTWADEGLATYVEPAPGGSTDAAFGDVRSDLLATLEFPATDLDLDRLLGTPSFQFHGSRRHYAAAWSLVHYLIHGHPKGIRGFRTLLAAWDDRRGLGPRTFTRVYGEDLERVEKAWRRHVEKLRERE